MPSYNLVDQPWIPCVMRDGCQERLGLRGVLFSANDIREILDPSPLVTVALYRLLLATLHRGLGGPASLGDWKRLRDGGQWDTPRLEAYFDRCYPRFDLFSEQQPFYQDRSLLDRGSSTERPTANDEGETEDGLVPVAKLARELASTRNPTLFDHTFDGVPAAFAPDKAARYLVAAQAFAMEDGRGYSPSPLTFGVSAVVYGNSLFESLLHNLLIYNSERPISSDLQEDRPLWECAAMPGPGAPVGYVSYLTWPHRRILLLPNDGAMSSVTYALLRSGPRLDKGWVEGLFDPMVSYSRSKEAGFVPVRLKEDRAMWRDSDALFQLVRHKYDREPGFVNLLSIAGVRNTVVNAFGVVAKKNKMDMWRHERLALPLAYLSDSDLLAQLSEALKLAEGVGRLFKAGFDESSGGGEARHIPRPFQLLAAGLLSPSDDRKPRQDDVRELVKSLAPERGYWPRLEVPFKGLLEDQIKDSGDPEGHRSTQLRQWCQTLRRAARQTFRETTRSLDTSARTLKARAHAERAFSAGLNRVLGDYLKTEEGGEA